MLKPEIVDTVARVVWTAAAGAFYYFGWSLGIDEMRELATLIVGATWIRRPGDTPASKGAVG